MIDSSFNKISNEIYFVLNPLKMFVVRIRSDSDGILLLVIVRIRLESVILRCFDEFAEFEVPVLQQYLFDLAIIDLNFGFKEGHQQR